MKTGVTVKGNRGLADILKDVNALSRREVLVGFPEDTTDRPPNPDEPPGMTNASIAYIQDNGAPEQKIPARQFMEPAIKAAQDKITDALGQVLQAALDGRGPTVIDKGLHRVGIIGAGSIKKTINDGIDPALAESTLRARARKGRKGAQEELNRRKAGLPPSTEFAKPLVDSGELRNAASYAIRNRNLRG